MEQEQPQLLLPRLLQPEEVVDLKPEESHIIAANVGHPTVQRFIKLLYHQALVDISENEAETAEQKEKAVARFNKLKGIIYVCNHLLNIGRRVDEARKVEAKKNELKK